MCKMFLTKIFNHQFDKYFSLLLLLAVLAMIPCFRPSIHGNDGVQNVAYLQSIVFDGDLDFTNDYALYYAAHPEWFDYHQIPLDPVTKKTVNLYGVGNSLLWSPLYILNVAFHLASDRMSDILPFSIGLESLAYALFGLIILYLFLSNRFGRFSAFAACATIWFCTPLFFYAYAHGSMSHANSFFLSVCLLVLCLGKEFRFRWLLLGIVSALLVLVRFQDTALLSILIVSELLSLFTRNKRPLSQCKQYLLFAVIFFCMISLQLFAWHILQGTAFSGPRAYMNQGQFFLFPTHLIQVLFSSYHGLIYCHPVLLLGILGLVLTIKKKDSFLCLTAFVAALWLVASWSCWWAGASFGHRMFISSFPMLAYGFAETYRFLSKHPYGKTLTIIIIMLSALWNAVYMWQYATQMIPHNASVSMTTVIRNCANIL